MCSVFPAGYSLHHLRPEALRSGILKIPFTSISLDGSYVAMYVFGLVATSIGEAAVMYILGLPLYRALRQSPVAEVLAEPEGAIA